MNVDDFIAKRFISSGRCSLVYEVELKSNFNPKKTYALKRTCLKTKANVEGILQERKVLEMITTCERTKESPFLPTLYGAFLISRISAALVIPAGSGVDLIALWYNYCPFSEEEMRFYAAEILCGLEALHALQIVHADLWSGNVIVMPSGHVMIIDFEHSLDISSGPIQHSEKHVGTAIYRHSKVAKGELISKKSDIWCWAIILLELLCGNTFSREAALDKVRNGELNIYGYISCSKTLKSLLQWCFQECPSDRPCWNEIKTHAFFRDLKWEDVESCKLEPPGRLDTSRCYRDPRECNPLVLQNLKQSVMLHVDINKIGGRPWIKYDWDKYYEESFLLYYDFRTELEQFDFVHPDEFQIEEGEQGDVKESGVEEAEEEKENEIGEREEGDQDENNRGREDGEIKSEICKCC